MEVFREFEVRDGTAPQFAELIEQVSKDLPTGWRRDEESERRLAEHSGGQHQFAFYVPPTATVPPERPRPAARLFIAPDENGLRVTNIVPDAVGQLTKAQYNSILMEFARIARPLAGLVGLRAVLTPDQIEMRELLSAPVWDALRQFSAAANKSSGSSHPMDRERWLRFIVLEHASGTHLKTDILKRWLIEEERWPEDVAFGLVGEFEFGTELLRAYDQQRI